MAKTHGKLGEIYWTPFMTATTIEFVDGGAGADSIQDSGSGFLVAGFKAGDLITVSGSTSNDGDYTIVSIANTTLTLSTGVLTAEDAGDSVTIFVAAPGQLLAAFFVWNFEDGVDVVDVSDFAAGAAGFKSYLVGLGDWTAEAGGYWLTDDFRHFLIGTEVRVRFFVLYDAAPNVTTVYFYSGRAIVTGIDVDSAVDTVIGEKLAFQGSGKAEVSGTGLAFVDGGGGADTITHTGNGFIAAGFQAGDHFNVVGSGSNDGAYTIVSVVAGTITLATATIAVEGAGADLTIGATVQLVLGATAWPT